MAFEFNDNGSSNRDYLLDDNGWRDCPAPSLRGHMWNEHMHPANIVRLGLPLLDIDIAAHRRIGLGWIVKRSFEGLVLPSDDLERAIEGYLEGQGTVGISVERYQLALASTIKRISDLNLAKVPWSIVDFAYPGASEIDVNLDWADEMYTFSELGAIIPEMMEGYSRESDPHSGIPADFVVDIRP